MALGGFYSAGTVDVTAANAAFTGHGVIWNDVVQGDWLIIGSTIGIIDTINSTFDGGTLRIVWPGTTATGVPYLIIKMSWLRYDPSLVQDKLRQLLGMLSTVGFIYTVVNPAIAPDPSQGENGQIALKSDVLPWKLWVKVGGVWVFQGNATGVNPRGAYSNLAAYLSGDVVSRGGPAYIALQPTSLTAAVTVSIATPGVITWTAHGLPAGTPVSFTSTGALPTGLVSGTQYYVLAAGLTTNTFEVSATVGGAAVNTSGTQSGVHTGQATGLHPPESSPTYWALLVSNGDVYDVGGFSPDRPGSSENILSWLMPRTVTFLAGLPGSLAKCGTAATATAVFSINKNGTPFGTITIAASGTVGVLASASDAVFATGDVLDVIGPNPRDLTLADMHVTLAGFR